MIRDVSRHKEDEERRSQNSRGDSRGSTDEHRGASDDEESSDSPYAAGATRRPRRKRREDDGHEITNDKMLSANRDDSKGIEGSPDGQDSFPEIQRRRCSVELLNEAHNVILIPKTNTDQLQKMPPNRIPGL